MTVDATKLTEIEGMLSEDTLTDRELVDAVRAAGLPELARVLNRVVVSLATTDHRTPAAGIRETTGERR
jgi:hypothetical protein